MARVPLNLKKWEYDETAGPAGTLYAIFENAPAANDPDPANFVPSVGFEVAIQLPKRATTFTLGG